MVSRRAHAVQANDGLSGRKTAAVARKKPRASRRKPAVAGLAPAEGPRPGATLISWPESGATAVDIGELVGQAHSVAPDRLDALAQEAAAKLAEPVEGSLTGAAVDGEVLPPEKPRHPINMELVSQIAANMAVDLTGWSFKRMQVSPLAEDEAMMLGSHILQLAEAFDILSIESQEDPRVCAIVNLALAFSVIARPRVLEVMQRRSAESAGASRDAFNAG